MYVSAAIYGDEFSDIWVFLRLEPDPALRLNDIFGLDLRISSGKARKSSETHAVAAGEVSSLNEVSESLHVISESMTDVPVKTLAVSTVILVMKVLLSANLRGLGSVCGMMTDGFLSKALKCTELQFHCSGVAAAKATVMS